MRASTHFVVLFCSLTGATAQLQLSFTRHDAALRSNFERRDANQPSGLPPPPSVATFPTDNYLILNTSVGTPPQNITLALTVLAPDSWIPNADWCDRQVKWGMCDFGAFDASRSSSFVHEDSPSFAPFSTQYVDGTYASGDTISETFRLGPLNGPDIEIKGATLGLANSTTSLIGAVGLGPGSTLLREMRANNVINSTGYSIWADDAGMRSGTGNILFGAVDAARYIPPLVRLETSSDFLVTLSSFNASRSPSDPFTELLPGQDLGNVYVAPTMAYANLPRILAEPIWEFAGATFNDSWRRAMIPCDKAAKSTARLAFQVGDSTGPRIEVPVSDLTLPESLFTTQTWSFDTNSSSSWCLFGVQSQDFADASPSRSARTWALGGPLLQRSYVTFDLVNDQIAIAPVKTESVGPSEVVPFPSYGAAIPRSAGQNSGTECESGSSTQFCSPPRSGAGYTSSPLAALIGIGVASVAALVLIALGIFCCVRRSRRKRLEAQLMVPPTGALMGEKSMPMGGHMLVPPPVAYSGDTGRGAATVLPPDVEKQAMSQRYA